MDMLVSFFTTLQRTLLDVFPIAAIIFGFQLLVIRKPIPHFKRVLIGFVYVLLGLTLFVQGLEQALFPLGKLMAKQLSDPAFIYAGAEQAGRVLHWTDYKWVYLFGAVMGFATTMAEPALLVIAIKVNLVSAGNISILGLRVVVAAGVAFGIALGTYRIVAGTPLHYYIIAGYIVVIIQTVYAPRTIIPIAYDSGGVATSTVTVPLVAALGLGLAANVPGRSSLIDGFGLIAFACLFPIITVMGYAQAARFMGKDKGRAAKK